MLSKDYIYDELRKRIKLLSRGILPPIFNGKVLDTFKTLGVGAGPQGKTFYIYSLNDNNYKKMISVPIYPYNHHLSRFALKTEIGEIPGTIIVDNDIILKSCILPEFLKIKLSDGTPIINKGIIMKHCYDTCTSVMGFHCKYFDSNEECKYCEISSVGIKKLGFPHKQTIDHFIEAVVLAKQKDKIRSLTITSGTFDESDEVAKYYIKILKKLKEKIDISINIQIEPLKDFNLLRELSKYSDTIGIFLEIFDEDIRREICPGKYKTSIDDYIKNWEKAVEYYGKSNVGTTCLLGFGEDYNNVLKKIEEFAKIGVMTSILFIRSKSDNLKNFIPSYLNKDEKELIGLHVESIKIMQKYDLFFKKGEKAGCLGCQGCTAMMEAADYVNSL